MKYFPATSRTVLERPPPLAIRPREVDPSAVDPRSSSPEVPPAAPRSNGVAPLEIPAEGVALLHAWPAEALAIPGRVLVVDDDEGVLKLVSQVLSNVGYQVCGCADGARAWDLFCAHHFDLVITDHTMPHLTGLDLLRRVRAAFCCVPCILMSGNMPVDDPEFTRLLTPGCSLNKPFGMAALVTSVRDLLVPPPGQLERESAAGTRLPLSSPALAANPPP